MLLLAKGLDRLQQGGFARGIEAGDHAGQGETADGEQGGHGNEFGGIESARSLHAAEHGHQTDRHGHADEAAPESENQAFQEKVKEDAAVGGAERFAQADLAGAFADRNQHDVDDADGAQSERDHADGAEEHVHDVEDGVDHLGFLDGIPFVEGIEVGGVEAVIAADDVVNFALSDQVVGGDQGLIFDEGDRVLVILSLEGKAGSHHREWNVAAHVEPVVVAATQVREAANDFKAHAVDEDEGADRGPAGEERFEQLVPKDDDVATLVKVELIDPAAFLEREEADLVELRLDPEDFDAGGGEFADLVQVGARQHGGGVANVGSLPDVEVVLMGEQVRTGGVHAALDHGRAAGEDEHDVAAELGQFALVAGAEAFAHADQEEQGSHAPGDAEHGEEGTKLVRPEVAEDLGKDVGHRPHY